MFFGYSANQFAQCRNRRNASTKSDILFYEKDILKRYGQKQTFGRKKSCPQCMRWYRDRRLTFMIVNPVGRTK